MKNSLLNNSITSLSHENRIASKQKLTQPASIKAICFDIGKEFVGILDDLWNFAKSFVNSFIPPEIGILVGSVITGFVGFIVSATEGYEGIKIAIEAFLNEKISQRYTKMITGALDVIFGGFGVGFSVTAVVGGSGLALASTPFMPFLIILSLTCIYTANLFRKGYIYKRACEEETRAKTTYVEQRNTLLPQLLSMCRQQYINRKAEREDAERKVAYASVEVFASTTALVGTLLGTAAIFTAAGVASFGVLPAALLIAGVVIGVSVKIFAKIDENNNYKYSSAIKNHFKHMWNKITAQKDELELDNELKTDAFEMQEFTNSTSQFLQTMQTNSPVSALPTLEIPSVKNAVFDKKLNEFRDLPRIPVTDFNHPLAFFANGEPDVREIKKPAFVAPTMGAS